MTEKGRREGEKGRREGKEPYYFGLVKWYSFEYCVCWRPPQNIPFSFLWIPGTHQLEQFTDLPSAQLMPRPGNRSIQQLGHKQHQ